IRLLPVVILPPQQYWDETFAYHAARQAVVAMARRFNGRISVWEIGNEYDLYCVKSGTDGASPADYSSKRFNVVRGLIQGMLAGLKDGSPHSRSIVETTQRTKTSLDSGFLARLMNDGVSFDFVGYHFYTRDGHVPMAGDRVNSLAALHSEFHKPIWITEFDQSASSPDRGPNADPAAQAIALTTALHEITVNAARYDVINADIYELLDQPELLHNPGDKPAQAQFGIFDAHGGYTAAATAVKNFVHAYYGFQPQ
ncbi:MAG: glycosyl hydrolase, partial [Gemmataceae bacterium]